MSAPFQKQTLLDIALISAGTWLVDVSNGSPAEVSRNQPRARVAPKADYNDRRWTSALAKRRRRMVSFDDFVGEREQVRRQFETD
jgi:hypothetical protein